jgi:small subunit ribosomal protein S15
MKRRKKPPSWVSYDKDEIVAIIKKLARTGLSSGQIGVVLRDQYGIPSVREFGIRLQPIVAKEREYQVPEDLLFLLRQAVRVYNHISRYKADARSRHALQRIESKIRSLARYYVKTHKLPPDWKYSIESAKLLVK